MIEVAAATLTMGSTDFYPDETPVVQVEVDGFLLDRAPVTNADFERFVAETGHVTLAEQALDPVLYPNLTNQELAPGSLVFVPTAGPVDLSDWRLWWQWVPGANWRRPRGPASSIDGLADHPVVQVSYTDALAYATWAGKRLPTEAELELAAGAGNDNSPYAWGEERDPNGVAMANTWRGRFPFENTGAHSATGTSPIGSFPANPWGFHDLIGNVWEWTTTPYLPHNRREPTTSCCSPQDTRLAASAEPGSTVPRRVLKGGSHLCAPEYCLRYRPAARSPQADDSPTSHIGFRCARSG